MPSTNFENSALKMSFSLSSLPVTETPEKGAIKPREFNSLKKKRRESLKRLSWGSSASEHRDKDEFWSSAIVESSYNFIMDNQLIDNCQDANCELSSDTNIWSIKELDAHFSELYSWLNSIQEKIYGHEDNVTDKTLRAICKTKLLEKQEFYNIFNEQGNKLIAKHPELKERLNWHLNFLGNKWEVLQSVLKSSDPEESDTIDIEREVKCLKNWVRNQFKSLQPLSFQKRWSRSEIETKAMEHKVQHRDIENHGKIVSSVVKLCRRSSDCGRSTLDVVIGLERRWHLLFLRSLEWQCYFENYFKKNNALFSDSESDEGPVKKQPRLCSGSPVSKECFSAEATSTTTQNDIDETDGNHENGTMSGNQENDTSRRPETEDAQFNISNQNAPNRVMFYFKHVDTDSDMEKIEQLQNIALEAEAQTNSETSEEEWTYSQKTPNKIPDYRKIVQEVEEMVSPIKQRVGNPTGEPALNKMTRIKQWLNMDNNKPEDSCDASSEDEENESESSEEQNESIATYKARESLNASCTDLGGFFVSTPKVVYRQRHQKSNIKGQRPSSIACITQLSKSSQRIEQDAPTYSISESALHTMPLTGSLSNNQGNSTSSTVEDSCAILNEENSSPIRRKRFKLKKKASCVLRKMDSASPYNGAASRELRSGTLVKSGSFSGCGCKSSNCDRQTVSDPSATPVGQNFETSATSGADTDEDKRARRMPMFKLGAKTNFAVEGERDDSPGKFSLTTNEEQSIPCDEAWDGYQEKYSSEAYSEAPDSDAARRLWEFGEDYRTHFGSQSDWSAQSSHLEFSPQFPRKCFTTMNVIDSDQEANNLRQLLKTSRNQLHYTDNIFQKQENLGIETFLINNDTKELTSTCDRHINCLADEKCDVLSPLDKKDISDLIMSWQKLKDRILKMQEYRSLQSEILRLTQQLNEIQIPAGDAAFTVNNIEDLSRDIDFYSAELSNIEEHKKKLLIVNVAVNHFMTENADYNSSSLKSNVSELYRIWYEINNSATERLNRLNLLLQSWKMLETRLDQLRGDLRDDEQTLGALDSALQGGTFSNQMASSVRGVAKLLSETKTEGCSFSEMLTEGSFSDSGISDEGSEHDLGERERRLSAIRRLVRQLEIVMAPDSAARVRMRERLAAAEEELKTLQNKCRSIIVRTAVSAAAPLSESVVAAGPSGDPGDDGPATKTASWFKRVVRASISFHFAIMALLFVACLLEPHCCDNMNNMQMSMNPQLQYVRGTPPI